MNTRVQKGSHFQIWATMFEPSASQGSLNQSRAFHAEQLAQERIDQPLLADQHPVEGDESRNGGQRPAEQEDREQGPHPPLPAQEEARQQHGSEHHDVHANADVEQGVDRGREVARVGEQLAIEAGSRAIQSP